MQHSSVSGGWEEGVIGGGPYGEKFDRLHSLSWNDSYGFIFAEESCFGWCEACREGKRHDVVV